MRLQRVPTRSRSLRVITRTSRIARQRYCNMYEPITRELSCTRNFGLGLKSLPSESENCRILGRGKFLVSGHSGQFSVCVFPETDWVSRSPISGNSSDTRPRCVCVDLRKSVWSAKNVATCTIEELRCGAICSTKIKEGSEQRRRTRKYRGCRAPIRFFVPVLQEALLKNAV